MNQVLKIAKKGEFISGAFCVALIILLTFTGGVFWTGGNLQSL